MLLANISVEAPTSGLYFTLNGMVYLPGDTVLITAIGDSGTDPDSSLVCVTSNVNMNCCRGSDGGNVGEWYFPSGAIVPRRNSDASSANFTRRGFTHQVQLNRRNGAISPTGIYECRVPDSGAGNGTAQITIGERTLACICHNSQNCHSVNPISAVLILETPIFVFFCNLAKGALIQ